MDLYNLYLVTFTRKEQKNFERNLLNDRSFNSIEEYFELCQEFNRNLRQVIGGGFDWGATPEGVKYWIDIADKAEEADIINDREELKQSLTTDEILELLRSNIKKGDDVRYVIDNLLDIIKENA